MISYLAAAVVAISPASHASATVQWQADYGKALEATRHDDHPLLVVIDDSKNEQSKIDAKLLSEHKQLLQKYQLCRVDVSTEYGKRVAERFGATKFPHTTIIDKTGKVVLFKKRGQIAEQEWKSVLETHKSGLLSTRMAHSTFFRGGSTQTASPAISTQGTIFSPNYSDPSYCPSCQRNAVQF